MKTLSCSPRADSFSHSKRSGAGGRVLRIAARVSGSGAVRWVEVRELAQDQGGGEADLGDEHDQPEEERPVPLPPVERHDHVARPRRAGCRCRPATRWSSLVALLVLDGDASGVTVDGDLDAFRQVPGRVGVPDDGRDAGLAGEDRQVGEDRAGLGDDAVQPGEQRSEPRRERGGDEDGPGGRILRVVASPDRARPRRRRRCRRPPLGRACAGMALPSSEMWNRAGSGAPKLWRCVWTSDGTTTARWVKTASTCSRVMWRIMSGSTMSPDSVSRTPSSQAARPVSSCTQRTRSRSASRRMPLSLPLSASSPAVHRGGVGGQLRRAAPRVVA